MANELATVEENWLELADKFKDLPMPFEKTVFLTECHLAGTAEIDDMLVRTKEVTKGTQLVLKRAAADVQDQTSLGAQDLVDLGHPVFGTDHEFEQVRNDRCVERGRGMVPIRGIDFQDAGLTRRMEEVPAVFVFGGAGPLDGIGRGGMEGRGEGVIRDEIEDVLALPGFQEAEDLLQAVPPGRGPPEDGLPEGDDVPFRGRFPFLGKFLRDFLLRDFPGLGYFLFLECQGFLGFIGSIVHVFCHGCHNSAIAEGMSSLCPRRAHLRFLHLEHSWWSGCG